MRSSGKLTKAAGDAVKVPEAASASAQDTASGVEGASITIRAIAPSLVDAGDRLRALDPAWVTLLAEEIALEGQLEPIRVVARGSRYLLIDGARRLAAAMQLDCWIEARVEPEAALADTASVRLAEIKANVMRGELTVLDRAFYIAAWRALYESVHTPPKRGRKPKQELNAQSAQISGAANDDAADPFILSFSEAAQRALDISRRSLFLALKIATIDPGVGRRLVGHPSADSRTEMLLLSEQTAERQAEIAELLVGDNRRLTTVAEALAFLDGGPQRARLEPFERVSQRFARLPLLQQHAFFELHAEAIERWGASRQARSRKGLRSVA